MPEKCSRFGATFRHAMERDPAADTHADGGDLCAFDEDPDAAIAPLSLDAELGQCRDQPVFQRGHEAANVAAARR